MSPRLHENFDDRIDVSENTTVMGALRDGATVRAGVRLDVTGSVEGSVTLEQGALLAVTGTAFFTFERNEGLAIITGMFDSSMLEGDGKVVVAAESFLVREDGDIVKLHRDGSEEVLEGDIGPGTSNVDSTHMLGWIPQQRQFKPMTL